MKPQKTIAGIEGLLNEIAESQADRDAPQEAPPTFDELQQKYGECFMKDKGKTIGRHKIYFALPNKISPDMYLDYLESYLYYNSKQVIEHSVGVNFTTNVEMKIREAMPTTIEGFCNYIGITKKTLIQMRRKEYPINDSDHDTEMVAALIDRTFQIVAEDWAKLLRSKNINIKGVMFYLVNNTDLKDVSVVEHESNKKALPEYLNPLLKETLNDILASNSGQNQIGE